MNLQNIENAALHLPREDRATLVQKLVLSFDIPTREELRTDWLIEARRRADDLDAGTVRAVPGDEVIRKAQAITK